MTTHGAMPRSVERILSRIGFVLPCVPRSETRRECVGHTQSYSVPVPFRETPDVRNNLARDKTESCSRDLVPLQNSVANLLGPTSAALWAPACRNIRFKVSCPLGKRTICSPCYGSALMRSHTKDNELARVLKINPGRSAKRVRFPSPPAPKAFGAVTPEQRQGGLCVAQFVPELSHSLQS